MKRGEEEKRGRRKEGKKKRGEEEESARGKEWDEIRGKRRKRRTEGKRATAREKDNTWIGPNPPLTKLGRHYWYCSQLSHSP